MPAVLVSELYLFRRHLGEYMDRVLAGELVIVKRHGRPVALLIPLRATRQETIDTVAAGLADLSFPVAARKRTTATLRAPDASR